MGYAVFEYFQKLAKWLLDLFLWVFGWLYALVSEILQWLYDRALDLLITALEAVGEYVPDDVMDVVVATFEWLEYINDWVPIKYGIGLLVAYYSIFLVLRVMRFMKSLIF